MDENKKKLEYYGGMLGAFTPFIFFIAVVIVLVVKGMITMDAYLAPMVIAIALSIFLCKDIRAACDSIIRGVTERTLAVIIFAFLGAGVLGKLMTSSGAVNAIVYIGYKTGATGTIFLIITFLVCSLIATSTGTSTGTVVTAVPVLYPAGVMLGVHPALLLGAIYSGARFGDNIAPISDTTIASATTQGADIKDVVRSRLKYAFVAAGATIVLYIIFNSFMGNKAAIDSAEMAATVESYGSNLASIAMVIAPAVTVFLCLRGKHLLHALWAGILTGMVIGMVTGSLTFSDLYSIVAPKQVGGAVTAGISGMATVIIVNIFLMGLLGALKDAGAMEAIAGWLGKFAKTKTSAELVCFLLVSVMYPITAVNTPALIFCGPLVKDIGERYDIRPARRANLIDLGGNGITGNLPHINTILSLAAAMIAASEANAGVPIVSLISVGLLTFHPIMLTIVALIAIFTGWGRDD